MTRIEEARRKARIARDAIGIGAVAAFALFAGLARASHPGTHRATVAGSTASASASAAQSGGYFGGGSYSSLGPSGSAAPQIQSGAS